MMLKKIYLELIAIHQELRALRQRDLRDNNKETEGGEQEVKIYYKCDGKACGENHDCGECKRTSKIEHAVNFEKVQHIYREKYSEDEKIKEPDHIEDTAELTINDLP